jgi:pimeloyl-ACP methyl ester carboxylesterase
MAVFENGPVRIRYEVHGRGFPLLLLAPGGMRSTIQAWQHAPWNPLEVLADAYQTIAMDQRNAGESSAPVSATHGWSTYAADQLALLDHLGIARCHVLGMCIGGPFCMELIRRAPERIVSAVLMQPIGRSSDNERAFRQLFDGWAEELKPRRTDVPADAWLAFREHLFGGDFLFNVSRDFVRSCSHPLLVLMGKDLYHPEPLSREIATLAPNAALIEQWKDGEQVAAGVAAVRAFLAAHTPAD